MKTIVEISDLKKMAAARVPKVFFDYADSGSWTQSTYRANESDFTRLLLKQKIAVDISSRNLKTEMVGQSVNLPFAMAPTGLTGMQRADGEILAAQACEEAGIPFTLSTMSICSLEDVASNTSKPFWFQLYVMRDRAFVADLIARAKAQACSALVLTFDLQILGQRHKDIRNGLSAPPKLTPKTLWQMITRPLWCYAMLRTRRHGFGNIVGHVKGVDDISSLSEWTAKQFDPKLSWDDIEWIKSQWGGPLILKGILDSEDAVKAANSGADALIVSNHGGRQLDGARSSIAAVAEIVDRVGNKIEVHMDGGIRSGQDVLKALSLGAKGVYLGRPFLYALGAMGKAGVTKAIDILRTELDITMALCGEQDVNNLGRHIIDPHSDLVKQYRINL